MYVTNKCFVFDPIGRFGPSEATIPRPLRLSGHRGIKILNNTTTISRKARTHTVSDRRKLRRETEREEGENWERY